MPWALGPAPKCWEQMPRNKHTALPFAEGSWCSVLPGKRTVWGKGKQQDWLFIIMGHETMYENVRCLLLPRLAGIIIESQNGFRSGGTLKPTQPQCHAVGWLLLPGCPWPQIHGLGMRHPQLWAAVPSDYRILLITFNLNFPFQFTAIPPCPLNG